MQSENTRQAMRFLDRVLDDPASARVHPDIKRLPDDLRRALLAGDSSSDTRELLRSNSTSAAYTDTTALDTKASQLLVGPKMDTVWTLSEEDMQDAAELLRSAGAAVADVTQLRTLPAVQWLVLPGRHTTRDRVWANYVKKGFAHYRLDEPLGHGSSRPPKLIVRVTRLAIVQGVALAAVVYARANQQTRIHASTQCKLYTFAEADQYVPSGQSPIVLVERVRSYVHFAEVGEAALALNRFYIPV